MFTMADSALVHRCTATAKPRIGVESRWAHTFARALLCFGELDGVSEKNEYRVVRDGLPLVIHKGGFHLATIVYRISTDSSCWERLCSVSVASREGSTAPHPSGTSSVGAVCQVLPGTTASTAHLPDVALGLASEASLHKLGLSRAGV